MRHDHEVVKLDGDLASKADMLSRDEVLSTGAYLSRISRPIIEREWAKLIKRASEEGK